MSKYQWHLQETHCSPHLTRSSFGRYVSCNISSSSSFSIFSTYPWVLANTNVSATKVWNIYTKEILEVFFKTAMGKIRKLLAKSQCMALYCYICTVYYIKRKITSIWTQHLLCICIQINKWKFVLYTNFTVCFWIAF